MTAITEEQWDDIRRYEKHRINLIISVIKALSDDYIKNYADVPSVFVSTDTIRIELETFPVSREQSPPDYVGIEAQFGHGGDPGDRYYAFYRNVDAECVTVHPNGDKWSCTIEDAIAEMRRLANCNRSELEKNYD